MKTKISNRIARLLVVLCVALAPCLTVFAQDKAPLPLLVAGRSWGIMYNMDNPLTGDHFPPKYGSVGLGDKVTFDGKEYFTVLRNGYHGPTDDNNKMLYYLREEGDKVYLRLSEADRERIVFDYSLEEGDYFFLPMTDGTSWQRIPVKLLKKEQLDMAGATRRVYYFAPYLDGKEYVYKPYDDGRFYVWIEGIGSTDLFVTYLKRGLVGGFPPITVCFTDENGVQHGLFGRDCEGKQNPSAQALYNASEKDTATAPTLRATESVKALPMVQPKQRWQIMLQPGSKLNPRTEPVYYSIKTEEPMVYDKKIYYLLESNIERIDRRGADRKVLCAVRDDEDGVEIYRFPFRIMDYTLKVGKYFPLYTQKAVTDAVNHAGISEQDIICGVLRKRETIDMAGAARECFYFEDIDGTPLVTEDDALRYYRWVDGIGSSSHPFFFERKETDGRSVSQAICFTDGDGVTHPIFGGSCGMADASEKVSLPREGIAATLAEGQLTLSAADGATHQVKVYTLSGELLRNLPAFRGTYTMPLSNCPSVIVVADGIGTKVVRQ